jgi:hypothetical protein
VDSQQSTSSWREYSHVLAYLLICVPVVMDLWYVREFGVNVPFADSWNGTLPIVKAFASGHVYWSQLYAPHNESRMLFPNLILGFVDSHAGANAKLDMYLTATIMAAALALLVWVARRSSGLSPWLLVPVAFLFFDWVQVENLLWAFQLAWMLTVASFMCCFWALERPSRHGWFLLACGAGLVASFSSLQGLLIWPVGLGYAALTLWHRTWLLVWTALGVAATVTYLWGFGNLGASSGLSYDLRHPLATLLYLLRLVGSPVPTSHHLTSGILIVGAALLLAYVAIRRRISVAQLRLPLALCATGILFDILVATGRTQLSVPASSRYTTYNLLFISGLYLAAVITLIPLDPMTRTKALLRRGLPPWEATVCLLVVATTIGTIALSIPSGLQVGRSYYNSRERGALLLRHYRTASDSQLARALFPPSGAYVKYWASWLQSRHWSVF